MADAKIITYGELISATTDVIPDGVDPALLIEDTAGLDFIEIDTANERLLLAGGGAKVGIGAGAGSRSELVAVRTSFTGGEEMVLLENTGAGNALTCQSGTSSGSVKVLDVKNGSGSVFTTFADGKITTGGETTALCSAGGIHIYDSDTGGTANTFADNLVIESTTHPGIQILGPGRNTIAFGDPQNNFAGEMRYAHGAGDADMWFFRMHGETAMCLDHDHKLGLNHEPVDASAQLTVAGNLTTALGNTGTSDDHGGTPRVINCTSHGLVVGSPVGLLSGGGGAQEIFTVASVQSANQFTVDTDPTNATSSAAVKTDPSLFKVLTGDSKTALEVTAKRELVMETLGGVDAFVVKTAAGITDDTYVEISPGSPGNGFLKLYSSTNEKLVISCDSTYAYFTGYNDLYFQTESNKDILFFPNGTGQVAIGTDAPSALFHVTTSDNEGCCKVAQTHEDNQATTFSASTESDDRGPALFTATHASFADGGSYGVLRINAKPAAGNGFALISATSADGADMQFQVLGDGTVSAGTGYDVVHSDYAEYFETTDGGSIAVGSSVVLEGGKVRAAQAGEQPIGVVRPNGTSSVVGNNPWNHWKDRYLRDDFGGYVKEAYTVTKWIEEVVESVREGGTPITRSEHRSFATDKIPSDVVVPDSATVSTTDKHGKPLMRQVENPDYDESLEYVTREDRDEWVIVGLLGQVPVLKDQVMGESWVKMRDVSDSVEFYFIK